MKRQGGRGEQKGNVRKKGSAGKDRDREGRRQARRKRRREKEHEKRGNIEKIMKRQRRVWAGKEEGKEETRKSI